MFFQKKKKKKVVETANAAEGREHYRKRSSKSQRLEALMRVEGWDPLPVELMDLTIRGAGLRVPFAGDRNLKVGNVIELTIGNMMRKEIVTPAMVVNVIPDGTTHVRYGCEFINAGNLFSQLDAFYARHFNRRRHLRVFPSLDRKMHATLAWTSGEMRVHIYDLSERGMGVVLSRDSSVRVVDVKQFEVRFKLPDCDAELRVDAKVKHRSPINQQFLLGLQFEVDGERGAKAHAPELREFVERRSAEMAQWESKVTPPKKS
jgi:hypothetical protein